MKIPDIPTNEPPRHEVEVLEEADGRHEAHGGGDTENQSKWMASGKENNRWFNTLYAIADPLFFVLCVMVGFMMILQAPLLGVPFIVSGAVVIYRVSHGKKSPWL